MIRKLGKDSALPEVITAVNYLIDKVDDTEVYVESDSEEFSALLSEFIEKYPTRTPGGRILSPKSINTILGEKIKKKLISITKNDINKLNYILKKLKDEVIFKKNSGDFEFMQGIEVWLNRGGWENEYAQDSSLVTGVPRGKSI